VLLAYDILSVSSSSRTFPATSSSPAAIADSSTALVLGRQMLRLHVGGCGRSLRLVRGSRKNATRPAGS